MDHNRITRTQELIAAKFSQLPNYTPATIASFVHQYFAPAGTDLRSCTPGDWSANPPFLSAIHNATLRAFASNVHSIWPSLCRQVQEDVYAYPQRHTLLAPSNPLLIVPGGRFRESYYWDSYWIVKGLLVSDMLQTAATVVDNLVDFGRRFGFVPNGGRAYYLTRSQPPMLSEMVRAVIAANPVDADDMLARALPVLEREHAFWTSNRSTPGLSPLNHYDAATTLPRPESFREDQALARSTRRAPDTLYREVAAGAETGWDFSSRWLSDRAHLATINTTNMVPVELQAIMLRLELNLCHFLRRLGDHRGADRFGAMASARQEAVDRLMWSEASGSWCDVDVSGNQMLEGSRCRESASNFMMLWALAPNLTQGCRVRVNTTRIMAAVTALRESPLIGAAGVATTDRRTGQQWDAPNAWAPLQQMLVEGLRGPVAASVGGAQLANTLTTRWVETNLVAFQKSHFMFEKYDYEVVGKGGGGGEYKPQTGFGWTNGVVLSMIAEHTAIPM